MLGRLYNFSHLICFCGVLHGLNFLMLTQPCVFSYKPRFGHHHFDIVLDLVCEYSV